PLTKVSTAPSDYSAGTSGCCTFGNDYGDYTGLSATQGFAYPVWTRRANAASFGDVFIAIPGTPTSHLVDAGATIGEGPNANPDGKLEPGEQFVLDEGLRNTGAP